MVQQLEFEQNYQLFDDLGSIEFELLESNRLIQMIRDHEEKKQHLKSQLHWWYQEEGRRNRFLVNVPARCCA